jgi:alpha-ribazole phosphatase
VAERLLLVRHGEVEGSRPGMLLGRTDLPLSTAGRRQAALTSRLVDKSDRFFCSPLVRARETAALAVPGRHAEVDPDLREMDFGEWERRRYDEVASEYPVLVAAWSEFGPDFTFPGGESVGDFASRIGRAARRFSELDVETVAAFTHGGVIRALICHFLGLPLRDYLLFDITPGSVTSLRLWEGRGVLAGLWPVETVADLTSAEGISAPGPTGTAGPQEG